MAIPIKQYDSGLLSNNPISKFTNNIETNVIVSGDDNFKIKANYGSVIIYGDNWVFDNDIIYASQLSLVDENDIDESKILNIVGTNDQIKYDIEFIKCVRNRHDVLRVLSVNQIPELSKTSFLFGVFAGVFGVFKRKRIK
jgi:hypothetical protein